MMASPAGRWGAALRGIMQRRGMTAVEMARMSGIGDVTIGHWVRGRSLPIPANAYALADALDEPGLVSLIEHLRGGTCVVCGRAWVDHGRHRRRSALRPACSYEPRRAREPGRAGLLSI